MEDVDKKELSERDICTKFITPAIKQANWKERQIREEVKLTNGRIIVKGSTTSRGKPKRADYILFYKPNIPLAVVEAKKNTHTSGRRHAAGTSICRDAGHSFCFQLEWRRLFTS